MSVRDGRTPPFIWASIAALAHLREHWSEDAGARQHVGRSVYYALCELANEDHARERVHENSGRFRTSRKRIVEQAGVSDKPVDRALRELERIGLLVVERTESAGARPGAASSYMLMEPGQTCGASPHVEEGKERAELVRTSSGEGPHVDEKGAEKVRTAPYRVKKTAKKQEVCSNTATTVAALPESIEAPLRQAAEGKEAALDPQAVRRACESYPDRDHAEEAESFAAWHLQGNGRNAPLNQVALAFRNWLKRAPAKSGRSAGLAASRPSSPVVETQAATEAWEAAKKLLAEQLPSSTFAIWIAPFEVAGERDGRLVIVDSSAQGGLGEWVKRRYRPLMLEAMDAFDEIEIVDETQLEMEQR